LEESRRLLIDGAIEVPFAGHRPEEADSILVSVGAYQLTQVLLASRRLAERDIPHRLVYMLEPGRFRQPRSEREAAHQVPPEQIQTLFPESAPFRVFVAHTRPELLLGVLAPLHTGASTAGLGYVSHGGTLTVEGLLYVNRCTWAHVLQSLARLRSVEETVYLTREEFEALHGRRSPMGPPPLEELGGGADNEPRLCQRSARSVVHCRAGWRAPSARIRAKGERSMSKREAYRKKAEAKLEEKKAEIDKARAQLKGAAADTRIEAERELGALEQKYQDSKKKLEELKGASEEAWEDLTKGLEDAWDDLTRSVKKMISRFR
jgi:hypothetical protein